MIAVGLQQELRYILHKFLIRSDGEDPDVSQVSDNKKNAMTEIKAHNKTKNKINIFFNRDCKQS